MICFATCAFGLSGLVRDELLALELPVLRVEDARVFFEADRVGVIRANLWLRCADRVFVELGHFPAVTFEQIYDGVRALPWHQLLPRDAAFTVTGKSALSQLFSVRDLQSLTKKAIADALMQAHRLSRCPETGQAYSIEIGMLRDEATVALNTSGPGLNRRGYRDLSAQAPLRETLAAAMVSLAYYHGDETLIDIILQSSIQSRGKPKSAPLRCNFRLRCKKPGANFLSERVHACVNKKYDLLYNRAIALNF